MTLQALEESSAPNYTGCYERAYYYKFNVKVTSIRFTISVVSKAMSVRRHNRDYALNPKPQNPKAASKTVRSESGKKAQTSPSRLRFWPAA